MINNKNKLLIEDTYIKLSPIEHILKKPGMYIGDIDFINEKQLIYLDNHIIEKDISWSPGLYKIVDELLTNVYDQTIRDTSLSKISVEITDNSFIIYNDGVGIDIIKHPIYKIYVPELIFANLLTSTNYDDTKKRITGGTHGLGAKLSAIFSKQFIVEVWDSKRKLYYKQIYENNLSKINVPIIEKIKKTIKINGGVKITIFPDFNKFGITKFNNDMINLLNRRVFDFISICKNDISIYLNNKLISPNNNNLEYYLNLYPSDQPWIISNCVKNPYWKFAIRFNDTHNIESGRHISFVNGINTNKGGKHVDYIIELLLEKFKKIISVDFTKKIFNEYITLYLKATVINPTFNSQTKEELNTPINKFGFECLIPESFWNKIKESNIIEQLKQIILLSNQKILSKFDGSKKSKIKNIPKLEDANFAGSNKSLECVLLLTEGDSAKTTAISGISAIKNGRNYYGVYPLRGKMLNVREASPTQINTNQEINDIKKILGLKSGYIYNKENINTLRYGSVMIMTDADEDGSHIKGLIINFFDYFFPTLLEIYGFLKILVTPLVKVTKGTLTLNFTNLRAYNSWKEKNNDVLTWKIKYYKGLGTSTSKEAGEYFQNIKLNTIDIVNTQSNPNPDMLLAFSKEKVYDRKIWLSNYNPNNILQIVPPTTININDFVNRELIHFSNYDNIRSIPSIKDGFKPSQRKVLYTCLKRNLINELKVAQLAASVAEKTMYHHGEQSLVLTIINMAQNFVGSNNLNLLVPQGQFGTRYMGGKDHSSARYIFTFLELYVDKIFIKSDSELLTYIEDDGYQIEPLFYLPIVPLVLVNGSEGIGTGFSTFIPNYNLLDIIIWLQNKLTNKINKNILIPYYKNFNGKIFKYNDTTWISEGIIEINKDKNELYIKELPIKLWINDYKDFLEEITIDNKLFKNYTNLSSDIQVNFILKFDPKNFNEIMKLYNNIESDKLNSLLKYLHLYKTIKQSNMNLYNINYKIQTYKTVEEILNDFYNWRLIFYDKRKELLLKKILDEKIFILNQIKFINLIMKDNGKIYQLNEIDINKYLINNKIHQINNSYDYLINMTFKQLNKNNLDKLKEKLNNINKNYKNIILLTNKQLWFNDLDELKKYF